MYGQIYLDVPYEEKEMAKALGAKWDSEIKKWYYRGSIYNYKKFARWITNGRIFTFIAHDYIYIIEGQKRCYKCKKQTRVVALGIAAVATVIYDQGDYSIEIDKEPMIQIAEVEDEKEIPPVILRYLQQHYNIYIKKSKKREYLRNHCDYCGRMMGNSSLYDEEKSPFMAAWPEQIEKKYRKLKIYRIAIKDDIALSWMPIYSGTEEGYYEYASIEDIVLSEDGCSPLSYGELYGLCITKEYAEDRGM